MRTCLKILPFVLLLLPITGLAQDTGLIPCGYGDEACNTAHVAEFANTIISYLISILSIFAVIVLVITGFQMVVSAGNSDQWGVLTQRLTNIVIGIVLILAAWLIVDTIMKALTGDGLDVWGRLTGAPAEQVASSGNDQVAAAGCATCVTVQRIPCKNSDSCSVHPDYADRLENLSGTGIEITEAWPPTRTHKATCHTNGTCTDVVFSDRNFTPERVREFQTLAAQNGFEAVYEPPSGMSCTGYTNCLPYNKTKSTNHHFSLYLQ